MADTIIFDVDFASSFKSLIGNNNVLFADPKLKDTIIRADDNSFLLVKKKIGSDITILSVDLVDNAFLKKLTA